MRKKHLAVAGVVLVLVIGGMVLTRTGITRNATKNPLPPVGAAEKQMEDTEPFPEPKVPSNGPVDEPLPWTWDSRVEAAKLLHNTPVLMAAYRATLSEPILAEAYNIGLAADLLAGTVVGPGEVFSQNKTIGPYTKDRGFKEGPMYVGGHIKPSTGGGVCKIASLLYNVVILSNLQVVERHPHSMTVPYVPPGQDATVSYGAYDFKFKNTSGGPVLIWADMAGNTVYMAFYGQEEPPKVTWHHKTLKRSKFWTEVRYNPSLPPGTEKVVMPGQEGVVVHSWLVIEKGDGTVIRRDMGKNHYRAGPRVIERGPHKKTA